MLTLTTEGILPPGCHSRTSSEVFDLFVKPFPASNRKYLFEEWATYNAKLKSFMGNQALPQWIDGSFVANKLQPGDIDIVTFTPFASYEPSVDELIDYYSTFSLYDRGLDAYICPVYPSGHLEYGLFLNRKQYWQKLFGSRKNEKGEKGFLELTL